MPLFPPRKHRAADSTPTQRHCEDSTSPQCSEQGLALRRSSINVGSDHSDGIRHQRLRRGDRQRIPCQELETDGGRVVAPQMGALYVSGRCKPSTCFLHGRVTVRASSGRADYQLSVSTHSEDRRREHGPLPRREGTRPMMRPHPPSSKPTTRKDPTSCHHRAVGTRASAAESGGGNSPVRAQVSYVAASKLKGLY